jgi:hypothetical protein
MSICERLATLTNFNFFCMLLIESFYEIRKNLSFAHESFNLILSGFPQILRVYRLYPNLAHFKPETRSNSQVKNIFSAKT